MVKPVVNGFPLRSWQLIWYCCITFFGVSGNIVVLIVIWKGSPRFRSTSYNLWLASLATADLLLSIIAVPNYVLSTSAYNHPDGKQGERLCKGLTGYSITFWLAETSIYHLVGISLERFKVVANPISARAEVSTLKTKIKITLAWILAFLVIVPRFPGIEYSRYHPAVGNYCTFHWPNLVFSQVLYVIVFLLNYIMPLIVLVYTSTRIRQHLTHQDRALNENMIGSNQKECIKKLDSRNRRSLRILLLVVVAFCICWTPHRVMYFIFQFLGGDSSMWNKGYFQIGVLLGLSNSFVNCILYAFMSDEFKMHFCTTFPSIVRLFNSLSLECKCKNIMSRRLLTMSDVQRRPDTGYGAIYNDG